MCCSLCRVPVVVDFGVVEGVHKKQVSKQDEEQQHHSSFISVLKYYKLPGVLLYFYYNYISQSPLSHILNASPTIKDQHPLHSHRPCTHIICTRFPFTPVYTFNHHSPHQPSCSTTFYIGGGGGNGGGIIPGPPGPPNGGMIAEGGGGGRGGGNVPGPPPLFIIIMGGGGGKRFIMGGGGACLIMPGRC